MLHCNMHAEMIGITESTTRVTMSTSTVGLPTDDDVNDTELAQLSKRCMTVFMNVQQYYHNIE